MRQQCPAMPAFISANQKHDPQHAVEIVDGKYAYHYVTPGIMLVCPSSGQPVQ